MMIKTIGADTFVPPDHKSLKSPVSYQMTRFGLEGSPDDTKVLLKNS